MADEVFALSPISARPVQPNEADYEAIREAFMETSRGRWFLGEYAKRNRNADTTMVLDAVARIEEALASQRQEPPPDEGLAEALGAIAAAVEQAAQAASAAIADSQLEQNLAPIHKGTRIIREISWRWREIGADGRICDMIDAQITAIEASCERVMAVDNRTAVVAAFDLIRRKLDEVREGNRAPAEAGMAAVATAAPAVPPEQAATSLPEAGPATMAAPNQVTSSEPGVPAGPPPAEPVMTAADPATMAAETVATEPEPAVAAAETAAAASFEADEMSAELADAHDEAVLEMIAVEMAAPDPAEDFFADEMTDVHVTLPPPVEPFVAARIDPPSQPPLATAPASPERPRMPPEGAPPVAPEPSLGSTIIASGLVQRSKPPADPLAPIRRMSQAEKIAFFS